MAGSQFILDLYTVTSGVTSESPPQLPPITHARQEAVGLFRQLDDLNVHPTKEVFLL